MPTTTPLHRLTHDLQNLLAGISGLAVLAGQALPDDHPAQADLDAILQASAAAAQLARQCGQATADAPGAVGLAALVRAQAALLAGLLGPAIALQLDLADDRAVVGDAVALGRVLCNLAANARDAMPDGGTLTIRSAPGWLAGAEAVVLEVADTGVGMAAAVQARVGTPGVTTKAHGQGLGLASCQALIGALGGTLAIRSAVGRGTTVQITLPCADAARAVGAVTALGDAA